MARFLLEEIKKVGQRPSVRLFMDKALTDFAFWKTGQSESHWKDLVRSSVQQQIVAPIHQLRDVSRRDRLEAERRLALEIYCSLPTHEERVAAWGERTRKSHSSFNRRIGELKNQGVLEVGAEHAA